MLFHHNSTPYEEARSEAAKHARAKMEEKISNGKKKAEQLLLHLEQNIPHDRLIRPPEMKFVPTDDGVEIEVLTEKTRLSVHNNALSQFASRTKIDYGYIRKLLDGFAEGEGEKKARKYLTPGAYSQEWRYELAAHIANNHLNNMLPKSRSNLLRAVGSQTRAFLSDNYDIYDGTALLAAFVEASQKLEVPPVPVESTCTDLRSSLKMFLPIVFEPVDGEVMCVGIEWFNSDFGCGKYGVRMTLWRLWCTNFAMLEEGLFEVHLGPRLTSDRLIQYSKKTMDLQTQARIEATKDIVNGLLGPEKVNSVLNAVRKADEEHVSWASAKNMLSKYLRKAELEEAGQLFASEDNMSVPRKQSLYKVSQILGLFAGRTDDGDRKMELERASGAVLMPILKA
jgi:hypothetical protein